ncbi:glycoside hydrolase [Rhypophila decipiens]
MIPSLKKAASIAAAMTFAVGSTALPLAGTNSTSPGNETAPIPGSGASGLANMVYFTNWGIYGRDYQPSQLPVSQITHVLYSFAKVNPNGEVYTSDSYADLEKHYPSDSWNDVGKNAYGCVKQLYALKKTNRHLKTLLSIGGWTYSATFPAAASTAESRALFAKTSVALLKDWGLDGLDIDWEYPANPTEAADFVLLLKAVRAELDAYSARSANGYHFLLTIASPAGPEKYNTMQLREMSQILDSFNLMAYDFSGSWDTNSGHQANLYPSKSNPKSTPFSTDKAVQDYILAGVPPSKIVLGMPIYGRAFEQTSGIGQPFNGIGPGSWENGIWDYKVLPKAGSTVLYDAEAGASYSYDAGSKTIISFDTVDMVQKKVDYLKSVKLGGSMFWEASGDKIGSESLLQASFERLGGIDRSSNLLRYPESQYENIRKNLQ